MTIKTKKNLWKIGFATLGVATITALPIALTSCNGSDNSAELSQAQADLEKAKADLEKVKAELAENQTASNQTKADLEKTKAELEQAIKEKEQAIKDKESIDPNNNWNKYNTVKYLANVWNTQSAEKNAMTLNAYNAGMAQFTVMTQQQQNVFDTTKVKVPEAKVAAKEAAADATKPTKEYCTIANPEEGKAIPVVFMDIDETIINNFAYQNYNLLNGKGFSGKSWGEYVNDPNSPQPALEGSIEFIKYVWNHGGVVFFNSGRLQAKDIPATKRVLMKAGLDEKYLPDWVWWCQGTQLFDENKQPYAQPWTHAKDTSRRDNKIFKTTKEDRANFVNDHEFNFTNVNGCGATGAEKIKFKTVMRVGDNFSDFNDNASSQLKNPEKIEFLNQHTKNLFGSLDVRNKGVRVEKVDPATNNGQKYTVKQEEWAESYILIGGNTAYGDFEKGIPQEVNESWFKLTDQEKQAAIETVLKGLYWEPSNTSK